VECGASAASNGPDVCPEPGREAGVSTTARTYWLTLPMDMLSTVEACQATACGQTHDPDGDFLECARRETAESVRKLDIPLEF
jgi:hypothetical protein